MNTKQYITCVLGVPCLHSKMIWVNIANCYGDFRYFLSELTLSESIYSYHVEVT